MKKTLEQIKNIRRAVCTMANELKKAGYSLSQAFKTAWQRVKKSMTFRLSGTTFDNRQNILAWLAQFQQADVNLTLQRESDNKYDPNAIKVIAHILPVKKRAVIGYVPKAYAKELAKVIDKGITVTATLSQIIGGYSYKEMLGALVDITI